MRIINVCIVILLVAFCHLITHAQIAQIPFRMTDKGLFVKVQVKGTDSLNFLFDTGGTGILMDSLAAVKAGIDLKTGKQTKAIGAGGSQMSTTVKNQRIGLSGNISLDNMDLTVMNMAGMNAGSNDKADGIIGYDLLNKYITQIDFSNRKLLLYTQLPAATTSYTAIPFEFYEGIKVPRFPVNMTLSNGETVTGKVMFDSGAATTLLVFAPFRNYYNLGSKLGKTLPANGRGINMATHDEQAVIKALKFNGFNALDLGPMSINVNVNNQAGKSKEYLGLLGLEIIKRYDVILDYSDKIIYLKPNGYDRPLSAVLVDYKMMEEWTAKQTAQKDMPNVSADEGKAFLEANKKVPGVVMLPSGLQYKVLKEGTGPIPDSTMKVIVHFVAAQVNGKILSSSYSVGYPIEMPVAKVSIKGMKEALLKMPAGSKWELYMPAELAFGSHTNYGLVPANSALMMEVEAVEIKK